MSGHGYIGLGDMGGAMVQHLLDAERTVVVFDIDSAAVERAVEIGALSAASAAEVAERCDVIEICVPAAAHVRAVLAEVEQTARPSTTLLVHSTVHPDTMREVADRAATWGGRAFDVCVGGGVANATEGDLVLFVGGLADMPDDAKELLDVLGSKVIDAGPIGAGAAVKIGFNVMTYAQFAAARTGTALVAEYGADPDALVEAWRHVGQLGVLTERALPLLSMTPAAVEEFGMGDFLRGHVAIGEKDLDLARSVGGAGPPVDDFLDAVARMLPGIYSVDPPTPRH